MDNDVTNDVVETFRNELGPELEYLADGLAPAVTGLVGHAVEHALDVREHALQQAKAAEAATTAVMTAFTEKRPDWKEHESAMLALAQKLDPKGMSDVEYLDHLYRAVTHASWQKERDAEAAKTARTDDATDVADRTAPRSFAECFAAARRGERFAADRSAEEPPRASERPTARSGAASLSLREAFAAAKRGERLE
jgi:hypothetical protein